MDRPFQEPSSTSGQQGTPATDLTRGSSDTLGSPAPLAWDPAMVVLVEQVKSLMSKLKVKAQQKTNGTKSAIPPKPTKLKLPVYDETGPVDKFLEQYEGYAREQDLMEQQKINCLFAQLMGKAADWYASVMHTQQPKDWAVGKMFRERFGELDQDMVNINALYTHRVERQLLTIS